MTYGQRISPALSLDVAHSSTKLVTVHCTQRPNPILAVLSSSSSFYWWNLLFPICRNITGATQSSRDSQNEDDHIFPGWPDSSRGLLPVHFWHLLHVSLGPWHDPSVHTTGTSCIQAGVVCSRWPQSRQSFYPSPRRLLKDSIPKVRTEFNMWALWVISNSPLILYIWPFC